MSTAKNDAQGQQLTSDLFHALSQPLTTLTCLLETALMRPSGPKHSRRDLQTALVQVKVVTRLTRTLRELADAGSAPRTKETLALDDCLREVVADLQPVAAAKRGGLLLAESCSYRVNIAASRLRPALYHLIQFAVDSSAAGEIAVTLQKRKRTAVIRITVPLGRAEAKGISARPSALEQQRRREEQSALEQRSRLSIARRVFENARGSVGCRHDGDGLQIVAVLPLVAMAR